MTSNITSLHGTWNLSGGDHKLTTEIPGDFHYALLILSLKKLKLKEYKMNKEIF